MKRILLVMGCLLFSNTFASEQDSGYQICRLAKSLFEEYKNGSSEVLPEEIAGLFLEATVVGSEEALYEYGLCLYSGFGVTKNPAEALTYFIAAAKKGHVEAQYRCGMCLLEKGKLFEARKYFKIAAQSGHLQAQSRLEETYRRPQ